jgi:hypothetical protein
MMVLMTTACGWTTASSRIIELIIRTPSAILAPAPIVTFGPIFAPGWTSAEGWMQTKPTIYSKGFIEGG